MPCRDISLKRVRYQSKGYVNLLLQTHRCSLDRRAAWWRRKNGSYFCRPSRERAHLLGSLLRRVVTRRCRTWRFVAGRRLDKAINRGNNCGTRGIIRLQFRLPLMNRACVSVSTTSKTPRERGPGVSDSRKCGHVTVDAVKKTLQDVRSVFFLTGYKSVIFKSLQIYLIHLSNHFISHPINLVIIFNVIFNVCGLVTFQYNEIIFIHFLDAIISHT